MDDEDTLVRQLAEGIYTDFDKPLMDMEFFVSDLASLCAKDPTALERFSKLVTLIQNRPEENPSEESEASDG